MKKNIFFISFLLFLCYFPISTFGECIKGDCRNGQGIKTYPDGREYTGEFKGGIPDGQGTLISPDGRKYVGEWKDGIPDGQGTAIYPDGRKYVGGFKNGELTGQGIKTAPDGMKYVGKVKNGKANGQGIKTAPNGRKYVGEFEDDKPNGQGTLTYPDGRKYVGEFKDGKANGQGNMTYPDGRKYVGEFRDGKANGQGIMTYPDGRKYVGEWKDGIPDGRKYVGEFKKKPHFETTSRAAKTYSENPPIFKPPRPKRVMNRSGTEALYKRGLLCASRGDLKSALMDFNKAIELNKTLKRRTTAALDVDIKIESVSKIINRNKGNMEALYNRGLLYASKGDLKSALMDYNKAIELNINDDADVFYNRAVMYIRMGKFKEAIKDFTKTITLNSNSADAYCNRGNAYSEINKISLAIKNYDEALKIDPNDGTIYYNRARAYFAIQNQNRAVADLEKAAKYGKSGIDDRHSAQGNKDKKRFPSSNSMSGKAKCDICSDPVPDGEGYVLKTVEVVTEPNYWSVAFRGAGSSIEMMPKNAVKEMFENQIKQQCSQKTGWLTCKKCISKFPKSNIENARQYAAEYWMKFGEGSYSPPGGEAVDPDKAMLAAATAWEKETGKQPPISAFP